jgi:AmmeMemoRadiSam system protein B
MRKEPVDKVTIRKRQLPLPWYPGDAAGVREFIAAMPEYPGARSAPAVMVPHAGWFYSGALALRALALLDRDADTVAVIGGHLSPMTRPLFAGEDAVETPLGPLEIDGEFRDILVKELGGRPDLQRDNTVEVQLPLIAHFLPHARLLWIRLPPAPASFEAGRRIGEIARTLKRKTVLAASTDLTHYGDPYGFAPQGSGLRALEWVKTVNDRRFIEAVEEGDPRKVLERGEGECSACSAGAVLGALGFAQALGLEAAKLLVYATSADTGSRAGALVPAAFVGYAAMAWHGKQEEGTR